MIAVSSACATARISGSLRPIQTQARRSSSVTAAARRRSVAAAAAAVPDEAQTRWNGDGKDCDMKEMESGGAPPAAAGGASMPQATQQTQWDGEGADYDMRDDVERLHDEHKAAKSHPEPDASQFNGEGADYSVVDEESLAEEDRRDRAVHRK